MKTIGILLCVLFPCVVSNAQEAAKDTRSLQAQVQAELNDQKGFFAVAFKDLATGETLFWNEHETFHAASTMKTPVMIEVYKQAAAGKFSLSDRVMVKNEFRSIVDSSIYQLNPADDSEQELYKLTGEQVPLSDLVYRMIIQSSNLATNIIMGMVGGKNVTQTMRQLGAKDIVVLRGVEDTKAFDKGWNNTTTAFDLMLIFEKIARLQAVNIHASESMINTLFDQHFGTIIPAMLPKEVKVAHKTGNITGSQHDSGIIYLPDGRKYVLVILSKGLEDEKTAVPAMARVSEMIYRYASRKPTHLDNSLK